MSRKIIQIDETKCVGCGLCANACQQSAIEMVDGKAKVVHDDYCDGIGNCLPVCPVGAISFSDRDIMNTKPPVIHSCPSSRGKQLAPPKGNANNAAVPSQLRQWPVQIKLVPTSAAYYENAHLLVAADCSAFTYGNFHNDFIKDKIVIIGCPKLDMVDYTEKLSEIIANNNIQSITVARMEVPCCGGIEHAAEQALKNSGKSLPYQVKTISIEGNLL